MAELLFEFAATSPPGGAVPLLFGDNPGEAILLDVTVAATLVPVVSIAVDGLDVFLGGGRADAAWGVAGGTSGRRTAAAWGAFEGGSASGGATAGWGDFDGLRLSGGGRPAWGRAGSVGARRVALAWDRAQARSQASQAPWGAAGALQRSVRPAWGRAGAALRVVNAQWGAADAAGRHLTARWGAGLHVVAPNRPLPADAVIPGFTPRENGPAHLHFCVLAADDSTDLVFGGEVCFVQPRIPDGYAIAPRRIYMQTHSIVAVRLPDLQAVPLFDFTLSADTEGFGWTLNASGPITLLSQLAPVAGVPQGLRLSIDGTPWEFVVEGLRRNRAFGSSTASIVARSAGVLLADPYVLETSYLNAVPLTAQQIVNEALDFTGVTLDWRCDDWTVPAGIWTFRGTPLAVARRVAESIGAIVQSPRAGDEIIIAPRYPVMPWDWASTLPDVTLALDAVVTEGYERADRPAYEGIYVSGQAQGVLALVKRTGTAPGLLLPTETDPLITDLVAAEQRGRARLGNTGAQARMTLSLPVLTGSGEPGVIDPGKLILVNDPAGAWKGLVRSVSVTYQTELRQTLTVERHL